MVNCQWPMVNCQCVMTLDIGQRTLDNPNPGNEAFGKPPLVRDVEGSSLAAISHSTTLRRRP